MTYAEKLRHPLWQKKRLEIFKRDNWACTSCGDKDKTLVVHHLVYYNNRQPWEYDNEDLTTFCEDCHKFEHALQTLAKVGVSIPNYPGL